MLVGWVKSSWDFRELDKTPGELLGPGLFQGVPYVPEPGLPYTASELGPWLGAPWGVKLEHEGQHGDESQGTDAGDAGPSVNDAPALRDSSGCIFMDNT